MEYTQERFEAIDVGSEKLEIPNGYNGGLFLSMMRH